MENNHVRVGFVDYLDRQNWWAAKEFFYDLITLTLGNYFASSIKTSRSLRMQENISKGCLQPIPSYNESEKGWIEDYEIIKKNIDLYNAYIQRHDCLFCYEGSPGILSLLEQNQSKYCDIRISPIRFLPSHGKATGQAYACSGTLNSSPCEQGFKILPLTYNVV